VKPEAPRREEGQASLTVGQVSFHHRATCQDGSAARLFCPESGVWHEQGALGHSLCRGGLRYGGFGIDRLAWRSFRPPKPAGYLSNFACSAFDLVTGTSRVAAQFQRTVLVGSSCLPFGWASFLSILLIATTIGTSAGSRRTWMITLRVVWGDSVFGGPPARHVR